MQRGQCSTVSQLALGLMLSRQRGGGARLLASHPTGSGASDTSWACAAMPASGNAAAIASAISFVAP
jgi:hypothetical protein